MVRFITFQVGFFLTPEYHTIVVVDEKEDHVEQTNRVKLDNPYVKNKNVKNTRNSLQNNFNEKKLK